MDVSGFFGSSKQVRVGVDSYLVDVSVIDRKGQAVDIYHCETPGLYFAFVASRGKSRVIVQGGPTPTRVQIISSPPLSGGKSMKWCKDGAWTVSYVRTVSASVDPKQCEDFSSVFVGAGFEEKPRHFVTAVATILLIKSGSSLYDKIRGDLERDHWLVEGRLRELA